MIANPTVAHRAVQLREQRLQDREARRIAGDAWIAAARTADQEFKDETGVYPNALPAMAAAQYRGELTGEREIAAVESFSRWCHTDRVNREYDAVRRLTRRPPRARRFAGRSRTRCSRGRTARHRQQSTARDDGGDPPPGDTEGNAHSVAPLRGGAR